MPTPPNEDDNHAALRPLFNALKPILRRVRQDVSAVKDADGVVAWTRQRLTEKNVYQHLNGGPARGVSPIKGGESVTLVAVLDLDSHGGEISWDMVAVTAATIIDQATTFFDLNGFAFRSSGGRGVHIYFMWDAPQDAYSVREHLTNLLIHCDLSPGTGGLIKSQVEIFPKQDSVPAEGFGNQFFLPLAGKSVPLEFNYVLGTMIPQDRAATWEPFISAPVPQLERPAETRAAADAPSGSQQDIETLKAALACIPNEGINAPDYDQWRDIIFGIHKTTGGSREGLAIAKEFSARNPTKYDEEFLINRVWKYVKAGGSIGIGTIIHHARQHGFEGVATPEVSDDEFSDAPEDEVGQQFDQFTNSFDEAQIISETAQPKTPTQLQRTDIAAAGLISAPAIIEDDMPLLIRLGPKTQYPGQAEAVLENVVKAVEHPKMAGASICFDTFRQQQMIEWEGEPRRSFEDIDKTKLRLRFEHQAFRPIADDLIRQSCALVAHRNEYDSAMQYVSSLTWDGTPRVANFFHDYLMTKLGPYSTAASLYTWIAMIGRIMVPGIKADITPILVSNEGFRKSAAIEAMNPGKEFYTKIDLHDDDIVNVRKLRGKLFVEIDEMKGLLTKEAGSIRSFMTAGSDSIRPLYSEYEVIHARRNLFLGTANGNELLSEGQHRRWAPIDVLDIIDTAAIAAVREQCFAEAVVLWKGCGSDLGELHRTLESLAVAEHGAYLVTDDWEAAIDRWLDGQVSLLDDAPKDRPYLTGSEIFLEALGIEARSIKTADQMRLSKLMHRMGWGKKKIRVGERTINAYVFQPVPTVK